MNTQRFLAFYTPRAFWVDAPANLENIGSPAFAKSMGEICYACVFEKFTLKIARDGLLMLSVGKLDRKESTPLPNIDQTIKLWRNYLEHINSLYLLLDSATIRCSSASFFNLNEITLRDAFTIHLDENDEFLGMQTLTGSFAGVLQHDRLPSQANTPQLLNRLMLRSTLPSSVIHHAVTRYKRAATEPELLRLLNSLAKGLSEYKQGNYETAVVLAWFLIEFHLNAIWEKFLETENKTMPDGVLRFGKDRERYLTKELTISMIVQHLEFAGLLDWETFRKVDATRKVRNRLAHRMPATASRDEASIALHLAHEFIENQSHIDIDLNSSLSIMSGI
ncbi:hypothetical protein [Variovorax sp. PAMC26660]|uniref:hypothetical protein n=1 Tax=Variovorax sp. PAMC26660 TaxID=2762322 RepID=UPI00164DC992|nr:hypothetical protein [Variovorax sp. PAMC26660]QNK66831.1 hypothetical protein H7F35_27220 [Variovorax sp. PAMC26660]